VEEGIGFSPQMMVFKHVKLMKLGEVRGSNGYGKVMNFGKI
jgi:hypothetical protein